MKRCPECKSVFRDDETSCGVCGRSLANASTESEEEIDREQVVDAAREKLAEREIGKVEDRQIARILSEFSVGFASLGGGIYLFGQGGWGIYVGFFMMILGLGLMVHASWGGYYPLRRRGVGRGR